MKNKIIKLLSVLICVTLMLSVISPAVFAEHYDGIYVQVNAPEDGKVIDFDRDVDYYDSKRYDAYSYTGEHFVDGVRICDLDAEKYVVPSNVATHEHTYSYEIIIKAKEGYGFSEYQGNPNVNGYIVFSGVTGLTNYTADVRWFDDSKDKIVLSCEYNVRITESIPFVSLDVTAPVQGQYPDYACDILSDYIEINHNFDDDEYCINGMTWHYADNVWDAIWLGPKMGNDEVFRGGHTYRLTIQIAAKHDYAHDTERKFGFSFAPLALNDKVLVNDYPTRGETTKGKPDDTYYSDSYYIIYIDFYCPPKNTVKEVALEVNPPMVGHNPDFDVAFVGEGYKAVQNPPEDGFIRGIKWRDQTAGKNLTQDDVFEANHHYVFSTYLEPADENSTLAVDSYGNTVVTGTMNGNEAQIYSGILIYGADPKGNDSRAISYDYDFGYCSNEITRVAVLDIEEPVAGEVPEYTATVKNNVLYSLDTGKVGTGIINGISWKNDATGEMMDETCIFEAGNQYSLFVYLTINDGYTLGNTVTSSINGKTSQSYAIGGNNNLVLVYTFDEVEPLKVVYNKALEMTFPLEGEYPYYDVELEGLDSVVKDVRWRDNSVGMDGTYITAQDAFVGGHQYQIEIDIVPGENYEFMTDEDGNPVVDFLFEIDGVDYDGIIEGTKNQITAIYNFVPLTISSVDVSIDVPSPGFEPSFIAYVSNDMCDVKEITWYDKTADVYITEGDGNVFEENHIYVVSMDIFAMGSTCFDAYSDKFVGTVNKKEADIDSVVYAKEGSNVLIMYDRFYAMRFSYEFEPCVEKASVSVEYDNHTDQIVYGYSLPGAEFDNLDKFVCYVAFYQGNKLVEATPYTTPLLNDGGSVTIPDGADSCKVMLWNKNTLAPQCDAVDCEIVREDF